MYLQQVEAITKIHWTDNTLLMEMFTKEKLSSVPTTLKPQPDMLLTLFGLYEQEGDNCSSEDWCYLA